jgi:ATP-dependent helicase/nuclease subunit A
MTMDVRVITASAGSGKTYRLAQLLDEAIATGSARPDGVMAVTFTNQAAAELVERARGRLLANGRVLEAHQLLAARIGTVNAVCGALVNDFAFELGMAPRLRVLDEHAAELEFRRAVGRVVDNELADELERFKWVFSSELDWRIEVRRVVEAARANNISPAGVAACAARSIADLDVCLGPVTSDDLDAQLASAIDVAIQQLVAANDTRKNTATHIELLRDATRALQRGNLRWGEWTKLGDGERHPYAKLDHLAEPVRLIARRHIEHPRLRADMHALIRHVFTIASHALEAYQEHKKTLGVLDFIDQEALALELLRRHDVREALAGQIDLFLVDEFQDTSPIQLAVFLELAALARQSVWVGDPKQAIYGFRGADPALMDAAIESLSNVAQDADLVTSATNAIAANRVERLTTSYRSRPGLVTLTNEIFARAFEHHGIPQERTRLVPKLIEEPAGLGEIVEHWPLASRNEEGRAVAVAAGVRNLLARKVNVRDGDGTVREARHSDIAVLCRKNAECREVAKALADLGVAAVVPRTGLVDTLEATVALAALALWVDPRDAVAAAELARILSHPEDLDALVARVLARPGHAAFDDEPIVVRLREARETSPDLGPLAALDAAIACSDLPRLCAEWGDSRQRLANLDALRAHGVTYIERQRAAGEAATVIGLLAFFHEIGSESSWRDQRTDSQALLAGENAVTISTWHAAKGLEWPITILFGLESMTKARSWGVHTLSTRTTIDIQDPLADRWIRFWPNPYNKSNQLGPVRTAVEASPAHAGLVQRAMREALRVLYVGWTRARDRLVLAAQPGKLLTGIISTVSAIDSSLVVDPRVSDACVVPVTWAGVTVEVRVAPAAPVEPEPAAREPGLVTVGNAPVVRARARVLPSESAAVAAEIGDVIELGPRLAVSNNPNMEHLGHAVHAFLAADRPVLRPDERVALARELLKGFGVDACLKAEDVVAASTRFWSWCDATYPNARAHREWPVAQRTAAGTVVAGTADLVLTTDGAFVLVDHKTFPGGVDIARERAKGYSGQLRAYATAVALALGTRAGATWIHFPVLGHVMEVRLAPA